MDFRRNVVSRSVIINERHVEVTSTYKYQGLLLDFHSESMWIIRSLMKLNVDPDIIALSFNAVLTSVLMYASTAYYGNLPSDMKRSWRVAVAPTRRPGTLTSKC